MQAPKPTSNTRTASVRRVICLANSQPENLARAVKTLETIDWIDTVCVHGTRINVRYDASGVNFGDIEELLGAAGLYPPARLSWRGRSAWYRFLDANARSHALSNGGACCSRPPVPRQGDK
ncbi:MAG: hypothetical protein ACLPXB_06340 [Thiobacillaceae bacterium]